MRGAGMWAQDTFFRGNLTATAGTAIAALIPPRKGARTRIGELNYTTGTTEHQLYFMRPLNFTTVVNAVSVGGTSLQLAADPGVYSKNWQFGPVGGAGPLAADDALAVNDYYVLELADGTFLLDTVKSVPTAYPGAVGFNATLPGPSGAVAVLAGAKFWYMGLYNDVDPRTGRAFESLNLLASKTDNPVSEQTGLGLVATAGPYEPIVLFDANGTTADTIERVSGFYGQ